MSLLPLSELVTLAHAEAMSYADTHQPYAIRRLVRQVSSIISECWQAQLRLAELTEAADRYLPAPDTAPDSYAEFLFRTSGPLRREPAADARSAAR